MLGFITLIVCSYVVYPEPGPPPPVVHWFHHLVRGLLRCPTPTKMNGKFQRILLLCDFPCMISILIFCDKVSLFVNQSLSKVKYLQKFTVLTRLLDSLQCKHVDFFLISDSSWSISPMVYENHEPPNYSAFTKLEGLIPNFGLTRAFNFCAHKPVDFGFSWNGWPVSFSALMPTMKMWLLVKIVLGYRLWRNTNSAWFLRAIQFICISSPSSFGCLVFLVFLTSANIFIESRLTIVDGELQKMPNKTAATKKAMVRAIKLFILGVILQGYTCPYFAN